MFCPNCGTQNSETASTCTKCGFNLKGAAAPKFKGTMLMNQAPGAPAPPGMGAPPPGMAAPRPPQQPGMPPVMPVNQGLAGTVVGVPPAGLGAVASAGAPPAPPPPPGYGAPPGGQFGAPPQDPYGAPPQPGYGAPPGGQFGAPPQDPYGAPPGGQFGAPTQQGGYGAPPGGQPAFGGAAGQPGGYAPPGQPAGGVNPLGGTMAIDQMPGFNPGNAPYGAPPPAAPPAGFPPPQGGPPGGGFGAPPADPYGAPPGGQFGAPPQQQQYGAPPQQQYGAPPADPYGAPPGGQFGAPPQQPGYGAPPQQPGYGAPPGQPGYGQPGQEFQQAGAAFGAAVNGGFGAMTAPAPAAGSKPTVRNPVTQLIMAWGIYIACIIVANILAFIPIVGMFSGLLYLVGLLGYGFSFKPMIQELQAYNGNEDFKWWLVLIPVVQLYVLWLKVPEQITAAKNKAGVLQAKPTKGIVMYVFLAPWAFANDLNDIAQ